MIGKRREMKIEERWREMKREKEEEKRKDGKRGRKTGQEQRSFVQLSFVHVFPLHLSFPRPIILLHDEKSDRRKEKGEEKLKEKLREREGETEQKRK